MMGIFLRIYYNGCFKDVSLNDYTRFSIGSETQNGLTIPNSDLKKEHVKFVNRDGAWELTCIGDVFLNGQVIKHCTLTPNQIFILSKQNRISMLVISEYSKSSKKVELVEEVSLGRNDKNKIVLKSQIVSGKHALIEKKGTEYHIKDLNSMNGTYVNGKAITNCILKNNDEIIIGDAKILFNNEALEIFGLDEGVSVHIEKPKQKVSYSERPIYKRSPRLKIEMPSDKVEIQNPPSIGSKPKMNISTLIMPIMYGVMAAASIVMGATLSPFMFIGVLMCIPTIITAKSAKKNYGKEEKLRISRYEQHLEETQKHIDEVHAKQLKALCSSNPDTKDCSKLVKNLSPKLWDRSPLDEDFMSVRVGNGKVASVVEIKTPTEALTLYDDELLKKGKLIAENNKFVTGAPIICDIKNNCMVGIVGERAKTVALAKNIVMQVTTTHSYEELKVVTIFPEKESNDWEWIRWLPHSFDAGRSFRFMASSSSETSELCRKFEDIVKERKAEIEDNSYGKKSLQIPYYLFVIADDENIKKQGIMKTLRGCEPNFGMGVIMLAGSKNDLYMECKEIIELHSKSGVMYNAENSSSIEEFAVDVVNKNDYDDFARSMAPIRMEEKTKATALPSCVTFLDGYNVKTPDQIDITENWKKALPFKSMAAPIGIRENGEKFLFDIYEKKHGPFGLVAGMAGSGKSEMVQSWILSMALAFSPSDVSFILIDFKGTGLIQPFEGFPHLAGTISNIDNKIHRNLIALQCELTRRQVIFNKYGVQNITEYQKLYHSGKAEEALPFLIIIIDEFAEFKAQFPEFGQFIDSLFRTGRSIGMYSVLLTQKPSGVVSAQSEANVKFRWCLRVASSADSKDMLHHADAAKITVPGRAYVQVGEDEIYEQVQSFWSGAPYNPNKKDKMTVVPKVSGITLQAKRISFKNRNKTMGIDYGRKEETKEINAVVDFLKKYVTENNIPEAKKVWTEKLPDRIVLNEVAELNFDGKVWRENKEDLNPVIGLVDDPRNQSQYPATVNLSELGHTGIFGAPSTGKTTLLQTLIMSVCCTYSPEDVNIYIMDFNTGSMGMFATFPHVGGVVNDSEEEKFDKLIKLISMEIESRKEKFSKLSLGNINAYREATGEKLPYIMLVVDNFAPMISLYPESDQFFLNLTRQGASYGVYLVATGNNQNALTYKIGQNIKNSIALQLIDKSEYQGIVGKTNGLEPDNVDGRGLIKSDVPLEFQTALPAVGDTDSERVRTIKIIAEEMNKVWTGKRAVQIPIMPDVIAYNTIAADGITIGLTTNEIYPIGIDFNETHYMVISGHPKSGKSNMISVIAKQMKSKYADCQLVIYDSNNGQTDLKNFADSYLTTGKELDDFMAETVTELQRRKDIFESGENQECFAPIVVVIDGLKKCYEEIDEKTAKRLEAIIRLGKGLNVHLIASEDAEELGKLSSMGNTISMLMVNNNLSIILGKTFKSHVIFKADLSYSEAETKLGEFEGYLIKDEHATRIKTMYCK